MGRLAPWRDGLVLNPVTGQVYIMDDGHLNWVPGGFNNPQVKGILKAYDNAVEHDKLKSNVAELKGKVSKWVKDTKHARLKANVEKLKGRVSKWVAERNRLASASETQSTSIRHSSDAHQQEKATGDTQEGDIGDHNKPQEKDSKDPRILTYHGNEFKRPKSIGDIQSDAGWGWDNIGSNIVGPLADFSSLIRFIEEFRTPEADIGYAEKELDYSFGEDQPLQRAELQKRIDEKYIEIVSSQTSPTIRQMEYLRDDKFVNQPLQQQALNEEIYRMQVELYNNKYGQ